MSACCYDLLVNFSDLICLCLKKNGVNENNLPLAKSVMINNLFYSILPFRVWNYLFLCERCQHSSWMCNRCTMMYIKHRGISDYINENLYIQLNENIPSQLCQGIVLAENMPLFVHTNVSRKRQGTLDWNYNFGTLLYESINSPFLLWKFYLEIVCGILFNVAYLKDE